MGQNDDVIELLLKDIKFDDKSKKDEFVAFAIDFIIGS